MKRDGGDVKGERVSRGEACHTPEAGDSVINGHIDSVTCIGRDSSAGGRASRTQTALPIQAGILGTRKSGDSEEGAAGRGLLFPAVTYTGAPASTGGSPTWKPGDKGAVVSEVPPGSSRANKEMLSQRHETITRTSSRR